MWAALGPLQRRRVATVPPICPTLVHIYTRKAIPRRLWALEAAARWIAYSRRASPTHPNTSIQLPFSARARARSGRPLEPNFFAQRATGHMERRRGLTRVGRSLRGGLLGRHDERVKLWKGDSLGKKNASGASIRQTNFHPFRRSRINLVGKPHGYLHASHCAASEA